MARIKRAAPSTGTPLDINKTRLPLALKPSNSTTLCSSSSSSPELSPTTMKINTNPPSSSVSQPSASQLLPKATKWSSTTTPRKKGTVMKKTKSISKAQIIDSKLDEEDNNSESDSEGQYDLATSIEESGGIEKFLETPCMILYKRNLSNQADLENYILKHLSSYGTNQCLFAGIKDSTRGGESINRTKYSVSVARRGIGHSTRSLQYAQSGDQSHDEEEKSDVENLDGGGSGAFNVATSEAEGDDEEQEKGISRIENEEETSQMNDPSGVKKRKDIRWKGGAKNTGIYQLLNKHDEVRECVHSVLSYGREHGVLLSGVQLKSLMDIENVEMTKDRAMALVELISRNVEIVNNPHFLAPTAQKPLFEYYGENFELSEVVPAASIPIPRTIMIKYKKDKSKKERTDDHNRSGKQDKEEASMNFHKAMPGEKPQERFFQSREDENANRIVQADEENLNENEIGSINNEQNNEEKNENMDKNDSKNDDNNMETTVHEKDILVNACVISEESIVNNENSDINSVQNMIERCSSPLPEKTHSLITIDTISDISPMPSADILNQEADALDDITESSSLIEQKSTKLQQKKKNAPVKRTSVAKGKKVNSKRKSFALRSKTKKKLQSAAVASIEPNQNEHMDAGSPTQSKKRKMNDSENSSEQYRTLTKRVGKIPKKPHIP